MRAMAGGDEVRLVEVLEDAGAVVGDEASEDLPLSVVFCLEDGEAHGDLI